MENKYFNTDKPFQNSFNGELIIVVSSFLIPLYIVTDHFFILHLNLNLEFIISTLTMYGIVIASFALYTRDIAVIRGGVSFLVLLVGFLFLYFTIIGLIEYNSVRYPRTIPLVNNYLVDFYIERRVYSKVFIYEYAKMKLVEFNIPINELLIHERNLLEKARTPDDIDKSVKIIRYNRNSYMFKLGMFLLENVGPDNLLIGGGLVIAGGLIWIANSIWDFLLEEED
jgi:hypothetical protein